MNREIKFRMWNYVERSPDKSRMFYDLSEVMECLKQQVLFDNKTQSRLGVAYNHISDGSVFMQYTGLKDKNGREIYEGDVLKCSYFKMSVGANFGATEVDAELVGVIEMGELSLCLTNIVGEKWSHYTGYGVGEGSCEITYLHDVYEGSTEAEMSIEIIGNIYETPELIK